MAVQSVMEIPTGRSNLALVIVIWTVVLIFSLVAIVDLILGVAVVLSIIWLAIVAIAVIGNVAEQGGLRACIIDWYSGFSEKHFVEIGGGEGWPKDIRFGFEWRGRRYTQRTFELDRFESVHWIPGQASGRSGKECNDWIVGVHFHVGHPQRWRREHCHVFCIWRGRQDSREFGLAFVELLRAAGLELAPSDKPDTFVRVR